MVEVIYLKDFGTHKKGDEIEMFESTAKPMVKAGVVKLKKDKSKTE